MDASDVNAIRLNMPTCLFLFRTVSHPWFLLAETTTAGVSDENEDIDDKMEEDEEEDDMGMAACYTTFNVKKQANKVIIVMSKTHRK